MTDEKCSYCKKLAEEGNKLIKHHSDEGLVRYFHEKVCLERHFNWENYVEEKQPSDFGVVTSDTNN